jgi:hypothetical protein
MPFFYWNKMQHGQQNMIFIFHYIVCMFPKRQTLVPSLPCAMHLNQNAIVAVCCARGVTAVSEIARQQQLLALRDECFDTPIAKISCRVGTVQ